MKRSLNGLRIKKELTVEKSVAKENEQPLKNVKYLQLLKKNVKLQEVNSLVQTLRSDDGAW